MIQKSARMGTGEQRKLEKDTDSEKRKTDKGGNHSHTKTQQCTYEDILGQF